MRKKLELAAAVVALIGVAACNSASAADKSLSHDLDLAAASTASAPTGLSLAPSAGRTDVISNVERTPEAAPAPKPSAPQRSAVHHSVQHTALAASAPVAATPVVVAPAPAPAPVAVAPAPTPDATPAPRPTPTRQAEPRGGYRSVGDVIRNAPFPINP